MVQAHRTSSSLLQPHLCRDSKVCRVLSHEFGLFDCTEPSLSTSLQGKQGVQGAYALVRGGSSTSNLPEPHHDRDSKVCRVLSHEFGVVPYRTFSVYTVTWETRSAGCSWTNLGWFKHIEPHRTFSNHIITEIARCVVFCQISSGWFDCTEPSPSTSLHVCLNHPELVHKHPALL